MFQFQIGMTINGLKRIFEILNPMKLNAQRIVDRNYSTLIFWGKLSKQFSHTDISDVDYECVVIANNVFSGLINI